MRAHVAPATQNQALNALVFLYDAVLERPLSDLGGVVRAKSKLHLPVVLSVEEVARVLALLPERVWQSSVRIQGRRAMAGCARSLLRLLVVPPQ